MEKRFRYKRDKRCRMLTVAHIAVIAGALASLYFLGHGGYLQAWLMFIVVLVAAFCSLSIPRYVKVDDDFLEIHCVVEMTRIEIRDIVSIRKVYKNTYPRLFIAMAVYGFFGYYGYYFSFRNWDFVKVYATEWNNLVEIEDIYEQKYLISCRESDQLIQLVAQASLERCNQTEE